MIELLLQAERALAVGLVDQAERLYTQAAGADPRNSIAVVGLARVALERGDEPEAWKLAQRALDIDPENVAAQRLAGRLEEVWAYRGESLPEAAGALGQPVAGAAPADGASRPAGEGPDAPAAVPATAPGATAEGAAPGPGTAPGATAEGAAPGPGTAPGPTAAGGPAVPPGPDHPPTTPPDATPPAPRGRRVVDRLFRRKRT